MNLGTFPTVLLAAVLLSFSISLSQEIAEGGSTRILAGYYPDWVGTNYPVDDIPYAKLTHVIWSFAYPTSDGSLDGSAIESPDDLDQMVLLAHSHNVKAILSLGGAGQCENFAPVSKDSTLRAKFVAELTDYAKVHSLDGVDLDWEFSKVPVDSADTASYNVLLTDIRKSLPESITLSAALPSSSYYGKYFTAEALINNLDWFGIMTYDITGDWDDKARFDSPLYPHSSLDYTTWSWKQSAAYWTKRGIPTEKLVFGVPSFGFVFYGTEGPGTDFDGAEQEDYAEIMKMTSWQFFYDSVAGEPYGIANDSFVTFENVQSAIEKANWIVENQYAGAMVWELSEDYMGEGDQPIVNTLSSVLLDGIVPERIAATRPQRPRSAIARYRYNALGKSASRRPAFGHYFYR